MQLLKQQPHHFRPKTRTIGIGENMNGKKQKRVETIFIYSFFVVMTFGILMSFIFFLHEVGRSKFDSFLPGLIITALWGYAFSLVWDRVYDRFSKKKESIHE